MTDSPFEKKVAEHIYKIYEQPESQQRNDGTTISFAERSKRMAMKTIKQNIERIINSLAEGGKTSFSFASYEATSKISIRFRDWIMTWLKNEGFTVQWPEGKTAEHCAVFWDS